MKIHESPLFRFAVLVPHRDCLKALRDYRRSLFAAGFPGAYSFPPVVPLALVSRPCTPGELRNLSASLRKISLSGDADGTFHTGEGTAAECPGGPVLWGPALDIRLSSLPFPPPDALNFRFPAPVLAAAIIGPRTGTAVTDDAPAAPPPVPRLSFRAAAVSNMILKPLPGGEYSFIWEIEKLYWLPSIK
jgi:hypothetical protein